MEGNCTYCGAASELEREHVIPVVYHITRSFDPSRQWIVPACGTCNRLAGSKLFFSIPEKAGYLLRRYRVRFRKALDLPFWKHEELNEMGYKLRKGIEQSMLTRMILLKRVSYLETVANYARDYLRPQWVEQEYKRYRKDMSKKRRAATLGKKASAKRGKPQKNKQPTNAGSPAYIV